MEFHTSGFVFKVGECVFDWFGELSGWCKGKCCGMGLPTKKTKNDKPIKKIKKQCYNEKRLLSDVDANVEAL